MAEIKKEDLVFTDTNKASNGAVLGTLEGPCADIIDSTRNGRHYSESLWEKVFKDPIVNEMIECGGVPGELDHPCDREETDSSRIAILMREKPYKKDGKLWAKFDILNTPLGNIAYTLAKAGFKLGVSSRGSGDVIQNFDGTEEVVESSYDFKAFDLVLLPAVKTARLNLVTEGLKGSKFDYKKALQESLNSANEEDRKIMKETLDNLGVTIEEEEEVNSQETGLNIEESETMAVDDAEAAVMNELQEALKDNRKLEQTITSLQEKLSVSYAKEAKLQEKINSYSKATQNLSESARKVDALTNKVNTLTEQLEECKKNLDASTQKVKHFREVSKSEAAKYNSLQEQLLLKDTEIKKLNEQFESYKKSANEKETALNEKLNDVQGNLDVKTKSYSQKLAKANKLVEQYKSATNKAIDKYIDSKARIIGVTKEEIKNRLPESYNFNDIDSICDSLREYKLNVSKLPFKTTKELNENVRMKATPSKNEALLPVGAFDDEIDDSLRNLAGL